MRIVLIYTASGRVSGHLAVGPCHFWLPPVAMRTASPHHAFAPAMRQGSPPTCLPSSQLHGGLKYASVCRVTGRLAMGPCPCTTPACQVARALGPPPVPQSARLPALGRPSQDLSCSTSIYSECIPGAPVPVCGIFLGGMRKACYRGKGKVEVHPASQRTRVLSCCHLRAIDGS